MLYILIESMLQLYICFYREVTLEIRIFIVVFLLNISSLFNLPEIALESKFNSLFFFSVLFVGYVVLPSENSHNSLRVVP